VKLTPGVRLGPYEIVAPAGAGGMGEVYKARDTRLGRTVAVKVLPAEFANDAKLKLRFEREAKAISALSHPNICSLFDVGESYLVMEYCEGKTLARRIAEGPLPVEQVIEYGIQIASALDKAHRQGIVHRDLKPSNIMLTKSGVKLLDFGLARQRNESNPDEATAQQLTDEGSIPGTVQYMAPEVLQGRPADARSDIFALGLVLYEMTAGVPAFTGSSKASIVAAILERSPRALERTVPPALERVVAACLAKDPEDRIQSAHDCALQLRSASLPDERIPRRPFIRGMAALVLVVVVTVAAAIFSRSRFARQGAPTATFHRLTNSAGLETAPALSPDAKFIAYVSSQTGDAEIYSLRIGGYNANNLTKSAGSTDAAPAWSPDGQEIAFSSDRDGGGIYRMGASGESVRRLTTFGDDPAWTPDGKDIVFASSPSNPFWTKGEGQLWRVPSAGGKPAQITDRERFDAVHPSCSPNGRRIVFASARFGTTNQRDILTVAATGGVPVHVTNDPSMDLNPIWSPDGEYVYFSSDRGGSMNLWRVAIDEETGAVSGQPEPLTSPAQWAGPISLSADGRHVAYSARESRSNIEKISIDPREARVVAGPSAVTKLSSIVDAPAVSPDGEWLAFREFPQDDIYIMRRDGTALRKLSPEGFADRLPQWSPDGKRIAFHSNRSGPVQVWLINADGSGLQQATDLPPPARAPVWSPDGTKLVVWVPNIQPSQACVVSLARELPATGCEAIPSFRDNWYVTFSDWSPDGKWLTGSAWERTGDRFGGQVVVYSLETRRYTDLGTWTAQPLWMSDSRRLLMLGDNKLMLIDRVTGSRKDLLASGPAPEDKVHRAFRASFATLTPDDRSLYFVRAEEEADIWLMTLGR
jgi:eukaryotic-like serine/threonine-protein kinase